MKFILLISFFVVSCASLPNRVSKIDPIYYTDTVNENFTRQAKQIYDEMGRECKVEFITKNSNILKADLSEGNISFNFLPITKPVIYSNANGMVIEKRIAFDQKIQMRDNALKIFHDGRRCFQQVPKGMTWGPRMHELGKLIDDQNNWTIDVTNGDTRLNLKAISKDVLEKSNVNPAGFNMYDMVVCADKDIDFKKDLIIKVTYKLDPPAECTIGWKVK